MILCFFQCGLIGLRDMPWIAASPDALCVIIPDKVGWDAGSPYIVATVEMKTKVSDNGVSQALPSATADVTAVKLSTGECAELVPVEHQLQLLHQCICTPLDVGLYVCASESQVLYTAIVVVPEEVSIAAKGACRDVICPPLMGAHEPSLDLEDTFPCRNIFMS